jgi:hypothetical protein
MRKAGYRGEDHLGVDVSSERLDARIGLEGAEVSVGESAVHLVGNRVILQVD